MQQIKCMQFQYQLEVGDILHINGIPCEYLGDGKIGTNTMLYKLAEETVSKDCKCIQPCQCPPPGTLESKQKLSKSLEDLVKALEKDAEQKKRDRFVVKESPWAPKGGLILDPLDNTVYGPGCSGINNTRIGDGCCT
jgi:hypothetical protein